MKRKYSLAHDIPDDDTQIYFDCYEYPNNTKKYFTNNINCTEEVKRAYAFLTKEFYDVQTVSSKDSPAFLLCEVNGGISVPVIPIFDLAGKIIAWNLEYINNPTSKLLIELGKFIHNIA